MWGFPNVMWDFPKWGLPSLFSQKGYYSCSPPRGAVVTSSSFWRWI